MTNIRGKLIKQLHVTGLVTLLSVFAISAAAAKIDNVISGIIQKVDKGTKTIVVKTANGTEETVKWTAKTTVHGMKSTATAADLAGREGEHVVVHYTGEGADITAVAIKSLGHSTPKEAEGTIKSIDRATHTIAIKTADGTEEIFHLTKDVIIDSGKDVAHGAEFVGKEGERISVHYTVEGGQKVAHFIKRVF